MSNKPIFNFSNPSNPQSSVLFSNSEQKKSTPFLSSLPQTSFFSSSNPLPSAQTNTFSLGEKNSTSIQSQKEDGLNKPLQSGLFSSNPFINAQASQIKNQNPFSMPLQVKSEVSNIKIEAQNLQESQILSSEEPKSDKKATEEAKDEIIPESEIESFEDYKLSYKKCEELNNLLKAELKAKSDEIISLRQVLTDHDKKEKEKANEIEAETRGLSQDLAQQDMLITKYKAEIAELQQKKHGLALNNFQLRMKIFLVQKNLEFSHQNYKKKLQAHDELLREQIQKLEKQNEFEKEKFLKDVKSIKRKYKSEMTAELKQNLVEASKFHFHNADCTENLDEIDKLNQKISKKAKELEAIKDEIDFNSDSLERIKGQINDLSEYEVTKNSHFMQETYGIVLVFLLGFLAHILIGPYLGLIK